MEKDLGGELLLTSRVEGQENEEDTSKETGNEIDFCKMEQNELRGKQDLPPSDEGDDGDEGRVDVETGAREHHGAGELEYQELNENLGEEDPAGGEAKRMRENVAVVGDRQGSEDGIVSEEKRGTIEGQGANDGRDASLSEGLIVTEDREGNEDRFLHVGKEDQVDRIVSGGPQDHSVSDGPQDHSVSDGPQDHSVSDGPQDHSVSDGPQDHSVSDGPQDHSVSDGPQDHSVSDGPQDHSVSGGPQYHSVSGGPQDHSVSGGPQDHSVSDVPQDHSVSDVPQDHVDHSVSGGPQDHSVSDVPQDHVDHSVSGGPQDHSVSGGPQDHSVNHVPQDHVDHSVSEEDLDETSCLVTGDDHTAGKDVTAGRVQNLRVDRDASDKQVKYQRIDVEMLQCGIEQDDDCQIVKETKRKKYDEDEDFKNGESEKLTSKMRSNEEMGQPEDIEGETFQEGGWGWVVMMAALWANGSIFGIQNSFGMLFILIQLELGDAEDPNLQFKTAWVGGLAMGVIFGGSPLVAMTTDRFGPRMTATVGSSVAFLGLLCSAFARSLPVLYVTYSLIFACGASFAYQPSLVILGRYFRRRLGLVNGLVTAGSSGFSIALPFLIRACSHRGLSFTFQILSIFIAILIFASLSYRPPTQDFQPLTHPLAVSRPRTTSEITSKESSKSCTGCLAWFRAHKQVKRSDFKCTCEFVKPFTVLGFRLWAFGVPLALCGYFVPYVHLMKFVSERFPKANGEILLVCLGVTSGVGRLACGHVADWLPGTSKVYLQVLSFVVIGLVSMLVPLCRTFSELICSVLLMGGADGAFISIMAPIAFELVGQASAGQAIGAMLGIMAIPMTAGPPIAGMLRDKLGSYDLAFYLAGVPPLLGAAVLASIPRLATTDGFRQKPKESRTETTKKDNEESLNSV
uniref:uncharacterized protein n=1 Tax=Myxine glutinosa TaxID=7769 RepID=UPI00358FB56F